MNTLSKEQIFADVQALCERTRLGAPTLSLASHAKRCKALVAISEALRASEGEILAAKLQGLAVPVGQEAKREAIVFLHDVIGMALGTDHTADHGLFPHIAGIAPAAHHGVDGLLVACGDQGPVL